MFDEAVWRPLRQQLDRADEAGSTVRFWLRDDDAVEQTPALDRLLGSARQAQVPMTLAVIPAFTGERLAARLAEEELISVAVHGWSHANHAGPREKKQELGLHRPIVDIIRELERGFVTLQALYGSRFIPMLVPPWNRIDPNLLPELAKIGYESVSVFGQEKDGPIRQINTHVDIMDWHGTRGCRPAADIVSDIVKQLQYRLAGSAEAIGILTHHLVHDEHAWNFINALFEALNGRASVRWTSASEIVP